MSVRYRTATPDDAERVVALFHGSFRDTFGHLYKPEDLSAFFDGHRPELWRDQLDSDGFAVRLVEEGD